MIKGALFGISVAVGILGIVVVGSSLDRVYPGWGGATILVLTLGALGAALGAALGLQK